MSRINGFLTALSVEKLHRYSKCWKLERTDAQEFFFTDHDVSIVVDGDTYIPGTGGLSVSASQVSDGSQSGTTEARGMLNSASITSEDLRSRKFDGCKITEFVVDFRFPFAGKFITSVFYIENLRHNERDVWSANLASQRMKLKQKRGRVLSKDCRFSFGDADCEVDATSYEVFGTVNSVTKDRQKFIISVVEADGYFDYGKIAWLTGANSGLVSEIKWNIGSSIELQERTPFTIQVGDDFDITPGCDRSYTTCVDKFDNVVNFGGDPFIPGTDKANETP